MADNTSSSDSDKVLITDNGLSVSSSCNAGTQTPDLPRRVINIPDIKTNTNETSQTSKVMVVQVTEDDLSNFEKEAKAMDIPDVVVEYIKDTHKLKTDSDGEESFGNVNPAFDGQCTIVRVPSRASLREDSKSDTVSLNMQMLPGSSNRSVASEEGLLPIGSHNPHLYYSMPRNAIKKIKAEDAPTRSQPSSPKMQRLNVDNNQTGISQSLMSLLQQQGANIVVPPSPNFGYRPLESETSAVYTIIKTCYNPETMEEIHYLHTLADAKKPSPMVKRKFEFSPAPEKVERIRKRLQCCTDSCSVMFLVPGILIAIFTPIFIIPMFLYPQGYFLIFLAMFACSGTFAILILVMSGLLGNTVWYYNDKTKKLRPRMHCGIGPLRHFWGGSFYYAADEKKKQSKDQKEIIV